MGRKRDTQFAQSLIGNVESHTAYVNRLTELSLSMFDWQNLPDTVDPRYLELALFGDGMAVFFRDEVLGELALKCMVGGQLNVYRVPIQRTAYAENGYQQKLSDKNSVIIWNNYLRTNSALDVNVFAKRLYAIDRAIDVNCNAQKTPMLILCDESEKLSMKNLYMQYDGNQPVIFGQRGLNPQSIQSINTGAPYVADRLYQLRTNIWNEALTYLGITNMSYQKKGNLITDEVARTQGGTIASRYSRLAMRQQACREINNMFGLDIWCEYRQDTILNGGTDDGEIYNGTTEHMREYSL